MRKAIKQKGRIVRALELGSGSATERELIAAGKLRALPGGGYEVFSFEAVNGSGEIVHAGDYVKVDGRGDPYPNLRTFFVANHRHLEGEYYEQIPKPLDIWTPEDGMCPEIAFLVANKGLVIRENDPARYYTAPLFGTLESAARDAVIVFYRILRDGSGSITDADFNFVDADEFRRTYDLLPRGDDGAGGK